MGAVLEIFQCKGNKKVSRQFIIYNHLYDIYILCLQKICILTLTGREKGKEGENIQRGRVECVNSPKMRK